MLLLILVLAALVIIKNPNVRMVLIFCLLYLFITKCRTYMTMDKRILLTESDLYSTQISVKPDSKLILWAKAPIKINQGIESKGICSIKLIADNNGICPVDIVKTSMEDIYVEDVKVYYKYIYGNGSTSATESVRLIYYDTELQNESEHFDEEDEVIDKTPIEDSDSKRKGPKHRRGNVLKPNMSLEFSDRDSDDEGLDKYFMQDESENNTSTRPAPKRVALNITNRLNDRNFALDQDKKPTYSGDDILSDYSNDDDYQ